MKTLLWISAALIFLSSCTSLSPFTQDLYNDLNFEESSIKKVQFYLSQDIVLYKDAGVEEAKVENGRIKIKEGRKVQEVIFRKGTPGVVLFMPKEERFAVSFDDDDGKFLIFGPNSRLNESYTLLGKEWDRNNGKVSYGGELYQTSTRNSLAALLVNVNKMKKVSVRRKEAKGRKV